MASSSPTLPTQPTRFVDRRLRPDAERAFHEGLTLLAGAAQAFEGRCAADTATHARILADLIEPGVSCLVTARRLLRDRAGAR